MEFPHFDAEMLATYLRNICRKLVQLHRIGLMLDRCSPQKNTLLIDPVQLVIDESTYILGIGERTVIANDSTFILETGKVVVGTKTIDLPAFVGGQSITTAEGITLTLAQDLAMQTQSPRFKQYPSLQNP
jgi:hypothetical protein